MDYEIPTFEADLKFNDLDDEATAENTAYAVWIGGNYLGSFSTDSTVKGTTLSIIVDCVWSAFDRIYQSGGRHFVSLVALPFHLAPIYTPIEEGGVGDFMIWENKTAYNVTMTKYKMKNYLTSVNTMLDYGLAVQQLIEKRWPGATFTWIDMHSLVMEMIASPAEYFEQPANVTHAWQNCKSFGHCIDKEGLLRESFVWFDELHPSQRVHEYPADEFIQTLEGNSNCSKTYRLVYCK
ncbi:unnamed protein product [Clonostachys rhizophaga]|uniref:Uncharacterized protein n=1 Tax=Clonostachys rhizophaga TaxID=160324 RepID=A0A9N9YT02_9HYPO|nr:unnamed protein product [Clonostachys rhizophaga]